MKKYVIVFLISMIPVVELRGAIPYAAASGLPFGWAYALSVFGNLLPVPFILWFIPALFSFMRRHHILVGLVDWLERKAQKGAKKIEKRQARAESEPSPEAEVGGDAAPETAASASDGPLPANGGKAVGERAETAFYPFSAGGWAQTENLHKCLISRWLAENRVGGCPRKLGATVLSHHRTCRSAYGGFPAMHHARWCWCLCLRSSVCR